VINVIELLAFLVEIGCGSPKIFSFCHVACRFFILSPVDLPRASFQEGQRQSKGLSGMAVMVDDQMVSSAPGMSPN
jgi:hypothetical protein